MTLFLTGSPTRYGEDHFTEDNGFLAEVKAALAEVTGKALPRVLLISAAPEPVRGVHGHAAHGVFTNVLLHFQDEVAAVRALNLEGVADPGKFCLGTTGRDIEMHIYNRSHDLRDVPCTVWHKSIVI